MRRATFVLGAAVAVCVVGVTQTSSTQSPVPVGPERHAAPVAGGAITTANVPMPTLTAEEAAAVARAMSRERLAALRARTGAVAQRAVLDAEEALFREPTAEEARALAPAAAPQTAVQVALPGGGAALKADASSVSLLTATVDESGRVVTSHDAKGARHDR